MEIKQQATDQWVKEEIKREVKKYLDTNVNGKNIPKVMIQNKNSSKKEVCINTCLHWKIRKISKKILPPNFLP